MTERQVQSYARQTWKRDRYGQTFLKRTFSFRVVKLQFFFHLFQITFKKGPKKFKKACLEVNHQLVSIFQ